MQFLLYALVFLFGFFTYRTFFIYRVAHASLFILRMSQRTSLIMLTRALENYHYTKSFCAERLTKSGATEKELKSFDIYIENDIEQLKKTSIRDINKAMPEQFKSSIVFHDWDTAMAFLEASKTSNYFKNQ
jgi:hypothetical protein